MNQNQAGFSEYQLPPGYHNPKTNGKSIAALVLGILSIIFPYIGFIIGIIAIVFANLALKEIKRKGEQGRGMAIAGLVCGIIATAIYAIILIVVIIGIVVAAAKFSTI